MIIREREIKDQLKSIEFEERMRMAKYQDRPKNEVKLTAFCGGV
jgi:hypothetical protein